MQSYTVRPMPWYLFTMMPTVRLCVWIAQPVTDSQPCKTRLLLSSVISDRQTLASCCSAFPQIFRVNAH
ncbi:hypothetical protein INT43_000159 [Umbelopsis isabellina]|uniref:Uncharacterized protein n=1 Tax=Mortierella isabellina TaxID=91625 RepID=A0A8H7PF55_MORIS|nr:hypothetical protein INT43_000159 [Umbelopsis isabellina]